MNDLDVYTFINKDVYPYPPNSTNTVLYQDTFNLVVSGDVDEKPELVKNPKNLDINSKNSKDSKSSQTDNDGLDNLSFDDDGFFSDGKPSMINILPVKNTLYKNEVYLPVKTGSPILINLSGTNKILGVSDARIGATNILDWFSRLMAIEDDANVFKIHKANVDPNLKTAFQEKTSVVEGKVIEHTIISYNEEIYITYQDIYILKVNDYKQLELVYSDYKTALQNKIHVHFKIIPEVQVYYCDPELNQCSTVELKDTKTVGRSSTYKGQMVFRNPKCGGGCDFFKKTTKLSSLDNVSDNPNDIGDGKVYNDVSFSETPNISITSSFATYYILIIVFLVIFVYFVWSN